MELWGEALYGNPCRECEFDWSLAATAAAAMIGETPTTFAGLLQGRDGSARLDGLAWSAVAYVCHVTDNLRIWAERLAGAALGAGPHVPGYDQDLLARARSYDEVGVTGALWSLRSAASDWLTAYALAGEAGIVLEHATRGRQRVEDVARNNAHDAYHHGWDISRILAAPSRPSAAVVRTGAGERIDAAGVTHLFKLTGEHTADRLGVEEFVLPPATVGARPHIHHEHDEYFLVVSGELTLAVEHGEISLTAGDFAHAPRGSVHGYRNARDEIPCTAWCFYTPPGYEGYFRAVHVAAEGGTQITPAVLAELRSAYATESL